MKFSNIYKAQFLKSIRSPGALIFILVAIIISLFAGYLVKDSNTNTLSVGIICEDNGDLGESVIDVVSNNDNHAVIYEDINKALRLLNQDRLEAVVIIPSDFTDKLESKDFTNTLEIYTSKSTQAEATVTEPLINSVLMIWLEDLIVSETKEYLESNNYSYSSEDERAQRNDIHELWYEGASINLVKINIDDDGYTENNFSSPFISCIKFFALFSTFYLIIDSSWVIDLNQKNLFTRISQLGIKRWKLILYSSFVPISFSIIGFLISSLLCISLIDGTLNSLLLTSIYVFIYLLSSLGISIFVASISKNMYELLFIAPLITFLNGFLGGLISELPEWAYILKKISYVFPSRWLSESMNNGKLQAGSILSMLIWLVFGIFISNRKGNNHMLFSKNT